MVMRPRTVKLDVRRVADSSDEEEARSEGFSQNGD